MKKGNNKSKAWALWIAGLIVFAINALVSQYVPVAHAQFIDRIVRPCQGGSARGTVQVTITDILVNPCPGGTVTINGVPITPGAGLPDPGSNGFVVRTALNTVVARTLTVSTPLSISNATGVAGNPLIVCPTCVTSAAALTSTALMTGAGLQAAQTPAANTTLDASGNIATPGSVSTGITGVANGAIDLSGTTSGTTTITTDSLAIGIILNGELTAPLTIRTGTALDTDLAGNLTVGAGGTITYTFTQTYASAPICVSSDTDAAPMITGASASTTVLTVTGTVGHVVNYICVGRN